MDKIISYIKKIETILSNHAAFNPIGDWQEYENQILKDKENGHFQLLRIGWRKDERVYQCVCHLDLKTDGKIWVQEDWTERGVALDLMDLGVPKEDIVLAFYAPKRRKETTFAIC